MRICDRYVTLLCGLMEGPDEEGVKAHLSEVGKGANGLDVAALVKGNLPDHEWHLSRLTNQTEML